MPSSEAWATTKRRALASAFALVSGYADIIAYLRWGSWGSVMTGNLIFFGNALISNNRLDALYYFTLIVAFLLGVMAYRAAEMRYPTRGASLLAFPLAALMMVTEVLLMVKPGKEPQLRFLMAGISPMFGMLLAACTSGKLGTATTMITGHLTTLGMGLVRALAEGGLPKAERCKMIIGSLVVVFTLLGAMLGVVSIRWLNHYGTEGLLLPVAPCLALLLWCYDHLAKPRSLVKKMQKRIRGKSASSGAGNSKRSIGSSAASTAGDVPEDSQSCEESEDFDSEEMEEAKAEQQEGQEQGPKDLQV